MIAAVTMNRMGHLTIMPASRRWRNRFRNLLRQAEAAHTKPDVYLQTEADVASFLESLPLSASKSIEQGWQTKVRMDEWEFGQMLGYDCGDRLMAK